MQKLITQSKAVRVKAVGAHPSPNLLKINEISFHKSDHTKSKIFNENLIIHLILFDLLLR